MSAAAADAGPAQFPLVFGLMTNIELYGTHVIARVRELLERSTEGVDDD